MQSTVCVCLSLTYTQRILLLDKSQEELEDDDDESAEYLDPTEARQVELSADEKAKKLAECAKLLARIADAQVALCRLLLHEYGVCIHVALTCPLCLWHSLLCTSAP